VIAALVLIRQVHGHQLGRRELRDRKELETRRYRNRVKGGARLGAPDASLDDQQERTVAVLDLDECECRAGQSCAPADAGVSSL
jgi:hypothetical protein